MDTLIFSPQNKAATDNPQTTNPDGGGTGGGGIVGTSSGPILAGEPPQVRPSLGRGFSGFPAGRGGMGVGAPPPLGSGAASSGQAALWANTRFSNDKDGKMAEKFRRLMGVKDVGELKLLLNLVSFFFFLLLLRDKVSA